MSGSQIMVVMIVLIVSIAGILKARYRARHGIVEDHWGNQQLVGTSDQTAPSPEMQKELDTLRERVKVLERIATDERQSRSIAAEIEALRDK